LCSKRKIKWAIDSSATHHVSNEADVMTNVKYLKRPIKMGCANKQPLIVDRIGEVVMRNPYDNQVLRLTKVRFAESCPMNLLSERRLRHKIIFLTVGNETHLIEIESGETLHIAKQDGRFWIVEMVLEQVAQASFKNKNNNKQVTYKNLKDKVQTLIETKINNFRNKYSNTKINYGEKVHAVKSNDDSDRNLTSVREQEELRSVLSLLKWM